MAHEANPTDPVRVIEGCLYGSSHRAIDHLVPGARALETAPKCVAPYSSASELAHESGRHTRLEERRTRLHCSETFHTELLACHVDCANPTFDACVGLLPCCMLLAGDDLSRLALHEVRLLKADVGLVFVVVEHGALSKLALGALGDPALGYPVLLETLCELWWCKW